MKRAHPELLVVLLAACGQGPTPLVRVDPLLTVDTFIGGDVVLVGAMRECDDDRLDVGVFGNGLPLVNHTDVVARPIALLNGETDPTYRFSVALEPARWSPADFGLPLAADVTLEVSCYGVPARSPAFPLVYLPTARSVIPAFAPRRFWADADADAVLACENGELVRYVDARTEAERLPLGFSCGAAEMPGIPSERRYLYARGGGMAAIDPGPTLVWSVAFNLVDAWAQAEAHPVVIYKVGDAYRAGTRHRDTGEPIGSDADLPGVPLGPPAANAQGTVRVLVGQRPPDLSALTYSVFTIEAGTGSTSLREVAHYAWSAPTMLAAFEVAGDALYVIVADSEEGDRSLRKVDLTSCDTGTCAASWSTGPGSTELVPIGEYWGRLLIARGEAFQWRDPNTGEALTPTFGPSTGRTFLRGHVEIDGSLVLITDPFEEIGRGLHIYGPEGEEVVALRRDNAAFRWVAPANDGAAMVGYYEELHHLLTRSAYQALKDP